jgi:hypothetical protein
MKKVLIFFLALMGGYFAYEQHVATDQGAEAYPGTNVARPAEQWRSGQQVRSQGEVIRILSDDNDGSRHQRFILRLSSGRTLLIAHNIDLAPRVASLRTGDTVAFYGQYESNDKGGVIHWTHHDPQGRHADGWLEHNGRRYQ